MNISASCLATPETTKASSTLSRYHRTCFVVLCGTVKPPFSILHRNRGLTNFIVGFCVKGDRLVTIAIKSTLN